MVEMLQHVQQVGNEDLLNAHDREDWRNLDNELPTVNSNGFQFDRSSFKRRADFI